MAPISSWPATRPSLFVAMKTRSDAAWRACMDAYGPLLYRYCRRQGLQDSDAEDVTASVLAKLITFEYQPHRGKFRAWLSIVVRREITRLRTRPQPRLDGDVAEIERTAEPLWADAFHADLLRVALHRIRQETEPSAWAAFAATWLDDRPPTDVALELGRTVGWVYQAKSAALKRLGIEVVRLRENSILSITGE